MVVVVVVVAVAPAVCLTRLRGGLGRYRMADHDALEARSSVVRCLAFSVCFATEVPSRPPLCFARLLCTCFRPTTEAAATGQPVKTMPNVPPYVHRYAGCF